MKIKNFDAVKNRQNWIAFILSLAMVFYGIWNLTDNWVVRAFGALFVWYLENQAQIMRGLGHAYRKQKQYWKAFGYDAGFFVYVVVFALISAVGLFLSFIDHGDQETAKAFKSVKRYERQYNQNAARMDSLNIQIADETKRSPIEGPRMKDLKNQYTELEKEQKRLDELINTTSTTNKDTSTNFYNLIGEVVKVPGRLLIIIVFTVGTGWVFLGLYLFPWDIPLDKTTIAPERKLSLTDDSKNLLAVVDALYDGEFSPPKLAGLERVATKTGLSRKQCKEYIDMLNQLQINGKSIINTVFGGSVPNFPLPVVQDWVKNNC